MSIFGKIRDAIFGKKHAEATPTTTRGTQVGTTGTATAERPPLIDVENHLDSMPGADHLNWRTSIVDLMKLLGIDSDYDARQALAVEMGRDDYSGTAEDNVWLHRRVMQDLGRSGGRVRSEYLD